MDYFNSIKRPVTFKDLYYYFEKNIENEEFENEIRQFLKNSTFKFEPQEALFRFLTWFKCIDNLEETIMLDGNFNKGIVIKYENEKFFNEKLKAGGDSSDMTLKKSKIYIVFTSKNYKEDTNPNNLDIEKIKNQKLYNEKNTLIGVILRDKKKVTELNKTSDAIKNDFEEVKKNKLLYDQEDIIKGIKQFKRKYKNGKISMKEGNKVEYKMRPHQEWTITKTKKLIEEGERKIIWGHVARSGKSYMMLFMIKELMKEKKVKILLVTTVPNETINQYKNMIYGTDIELRVELSNEYKNKKENEEENILMISSSQLLNNKVNKEYKKEYVKMDYDIVFIDEAHYGGSTDKIIEMLKEVVVNNKKTVWIYVTATYTKPEMRLNIKKENVITWNLVDIGMMKNKEKEKIIRRKGEIFKNIIKNNEKIEDEYKIYPEMEIIQLNIEKNLIEEIKDKGKCDGFGWSIESLFNIINEEFENYDTLEKITEEIVGEGLSRMGKGSIISQLKNKRVKNVIMVYLPVKSKTSISILQNKYKELMENNYYINSNYKIITMNTNENNKPEEINNEIKNLENEKDIIVLCGDMCSIGITIENCDFVVLMNNTESYDNIYQKMFRCMTERYGKKKGYVIDINMRRSVNIIVEMARTMTNSGNTKEALKEMLETRMINFKRRDLEWKNDVKMDLEEKVEFIIDEWRKNNINSMEKIVETNIKGITIDYKSIIELNRIINNVKNIKKKSEILYSNNILDEIGNGTVKDEIEKYKEKSDKEEKDEEIIDIEMFLKMLLPALGFMTMNEQLNYSLSVEKMIGKILIFLREKTIIKEAKKGNTEKIQELISNIYNNMDEEDKRKIDDTLEEIRNMYKKECKNRKRLGELVDKYLLPTIEEKKQNAEVSTPVELRKEMINKLKEYKPDVFTNKNIKIFEPCTGKGGFVVDLIDELMDGLNNVIKNEEERYKHILENCIYMSELNEWNKYIVEKLINPEGKYEIKFNEGDTLQLSIKQKWNLEGFDVIIGNPPYQGKRKENKAKGGGGRTLWDCFVRWSIENTKKNGRIVLVHPSGWRKPFNTRSFYTDLYKILTKENQMEYLSIHGTEDGNKVFKCGTRFDWYVVERTKKYKETKIKTEDGKEENVDLGDYIFLPNKNIDIIKKYLLRNNENACNIIYSRGAYGSDRKWVVDEESEEYKYKLVHTTPKNGTRWKYTNINTKGHFGIKKVIFGDTRLDTPVIDMNGEYGMTNHSMAIEVENEEEAKKLEEFLKSEEMKTIVESSKWSNYMIDWNMFKYMKDKFWM